MKAARARVKVEDEKSRLALHAGFSLAGAIAVFILAPLAVLLVLTWICRIPAARVFDYGSAQLAYHVRLFRSGMPLYSDCRAGRSLPLTYGPIVFWLTAAISPLFGSKVSAGLDDRSRSGQRSQRVSVLGGIPAIGSILMETADTAFRLDSRTHTH